MNLQDGIREPFDSFALAHRRGHSLTLMMCSKTTMNCNIQHRSATLLRPLNSHCHSSVVKVHFPNPNDALRLPKNCNFPTEGAEAKAATALKKNNTKKPPTTFQMEGKKYDMPYSVT